MTGNEVTNELMAGFPEAQALLGGDRGAESMVDGGHFVYAAAEVFSIISPYIYHTHAATVFGEVSAALRRAQEASADVISQLHVAEKGQDREHRLRVAEANQHLARLKDLQGLLRARVERETSLSNKRHALKRRLGEEKARSSGLREKLTLAEEKLHCLRKEVQGDMTAVEQWWTTMLVESVAEARAAAKAEARVQAEEAARQATLALSEENAELRRAVKALKVENGALQKSLLLRPAPVRIEEGSRYPEEIYRISVGALRQREEDGPRHKQARSEGAFPSPFLPIGTERPGPGTTRGGVSALQDGSAAVLGEPFKGEVNDDDVIMMTSSACSPSRTRARPTAPQPTPAIPVSCSSNRDLPPISKAEAGGNNVVCGDISHNISSVLPSLWKAFIDRPKGGSWVATDKEEEEEESDRPVVGGVISAGSAAWQRDVVGNRSHVDCAPCSEDVFVGVDGDGLVNGGDHQASGVSNSARLTRDGLSADRSRVANAHEPTFFQRIFGVSGGGGGGGGGADRGAEAGGLSFLSSVQNREPSGAMKVGALSGAGSTAAPSSFAGDQHRGDQHRSAFSEMVDGESTAHYVERTGGGSCGVDGSGRGGRLTFGRRRGLGALAGPNGGRADSVAAKFDSGNHPAAFSEAGSFSQMDTPWRSLGGGSSPLSLKALLGNGEFYPGNTSIEDGRPGSGGSSLPKRGATSFRRVRLRDCASDEQGGFDGLSGVAEDEEGAKRVEAAGAEKVVSGDVVCSGKTEEAVVEPSARMATGLETGGGRGGGEGVLSDGAGGGVRDQSNWRKDAASPATTAATAADPAALPDESGETHSRTAVGKDSDEDATACANNSARLFPAGCGGSEGVDVGVGSGSGGVRGSGGGGGGGDDTRTLSASKRWLSEPEHGEGPSFEAAAAPAVAVVGKQKSLDDLLRDMDIAPEEGGGGESGGDGCVGDVDQKRRFDDFMARSCRSTGRTRLL